MELKIRYLGQCAFCLDDGTTRIVTDPYLSDAVDRATQNSANPWKRAYPAPVTLSECDPDAILISHSHTDHLDPITLGDYYKENGRAMLCVPKPEVPLAEKLAPNNTFPCRAEESFTIGNVTVTPIACAHTKLHMDDEGSFHELSYFIDFDGICVFFGGDMSLYDGLVWRIRDEYPDILLLPTNGRDEERTNAGIVGNLTEVEAAEVAFDIGTPFIPMHHDLYPGNGCSVERILSAADKKDATAIVLKPGETYTITREDK